MTDTVSIQPRRPVFESPQFGGARMKPVKLVVLMMILTLCLPACDSGDGDDGNPGWGNPGDNGDGDGDGDSGDDDFECKSCVDKPDAIPADDNRSSGVYKGVLTGSNSTGNLKAMIATDESTGSCDVTVDDEDDKADDFEIDSAGEDVQYTFSSDDFEVVIVISSDGTVVSVTVTVKGNSMEATVMKETSDQLVKGFEGTWKGTDNDTGIWNLIMYGSTLQGYSSGGGNFYGDVSGSKVTIYIYETEAAQGTISGDKITGTYDVDESSGTWEGYRTL